MAMNLAGIGRKGVVFTIMAMLISAIFGITATIFTHNTQSGEDEAILLRVQIVDDLTSAFISHAHNALRISTYEALDTMSYVLSQQSDDHMIVYYRDVEAVVEALQACALRPGWAIFVPDSQDGHVFADTPCVERAIPMMLDNFTALANDSLNAQITYSIDYDSFNISETIPYELFVNMTMNITVIDAFSNWSIVDEPISAYVSLFGIQDPVTSKFALGPEAASYVDTALFTAYNFTPTNITRWDVNSTLEFMNSKRYRLSQEAPSILGRYYGNFSPSDCCGVETLINGSELVVTEWQERPNSRLLGLGGSNYSFLDYELLRSDSDSDFEPPLFFCDGDAPATIRLDYPENSQSYFWLNQSTVARYNITGTDWATC